MIDKIFKFFKVHFTAEAELQDGTKIFIDGDLVKGTKVFIITEDGNMTMPDGDYVLIDETVITVKDGLIEDIIEVSKDEPVTEVEQKVEKLSDEVETAVEPVEDVKKEDDVVVKIDELLTKITNLENRIVEIESGLTKEVKQSIDKVEKLSNDFNTIFEKVTLAKDIKKNVVEKNENLTLFEQRMNYISELRNKK